MKKTAKSALIGVAIGFVNGLFGAGGGTLAVPFMERHLGVPEHKAHATAIAIILPLSIVSLFVYFGKTEIGWLEILYVSIGGVAGGYIGAKLLRKFTSKWLHILFGGFMIAAAVRMVF